ncbi:DEAD/DEAH box helicase [Frankia sp. CiP3]|uniref:DEAD/DEAH box helicase n=1 Tax=Frankia sp. CiP3 TaxID=2880971 RepID=UPI001EF440F4|nr:DEAD/DEAH box helicase [Frankia sp. CiP3]
MPPSLVTALARQGITAPFPVQAATLPDVLAGENVLGRASTGSGKTLGFGLPMLAELSKNRAVAPGRPRGLILVPTRELAQQVHDALDPLARPLGLRLRAVYGGTSISRQISSLRRGVHIVVATPGRLTDLIERGACSLEEIAITVLDEADYMCDLGFLPAVRALLDATPAGGQRLLFSATLDREVEVLVRQYLPEPVLVAIDSETAQVSTLSRHALEAADPAAHTRLVTALAGGSGRTLVFARTQRGADRLAEQLTRSGVPAQPLHGGMAQNARTRALAGFADGAHRVLVATDVAARGIHVDGVDIVVHAGLPSDPKTYQHRGGRTARAGAHGADVLVSLPEERGIVRALLRAAGSDAQPEPADADAEVVARLAGPPAPRVLPQQRTATQSLPASASSRVPAQGRPGGGSRRGTDKQWGASSSRGGSASGGRGGSDQQRRGGRRQGPASTTTTGQG